MLDDLLFRAGLAYRWVADSETGDAIPRPVFHCQLRKPTVLFITGESGSGKSTLTRTLARAYDVVDFSIDRWGHELYQRLNPEQSIDRLTLNGVLEIYYGGTPTDTLAVLADDLESEIRRRTRPAGLLIVDGLDRRHEAFGAVLKEVVARLSEDYVVWSASAEVNTFGS